MFLYLSSVWNISIPRKVLVINAIAYQVVLKWKHWSAVTNVNESTYNNLSSFQQKLWIMYIARMNVFEVNKIKYEGKCRQFNIFLLQKQSLFVARNNQQ